MSTPDEQVKKALPVENKRASLRAGKIISEIKTHRDSLIAEGKALCEEIATIQHDSKSAKIIADKLFNFSKTLFKELKADDLRKLNNDDLDIMDLRNKYAKNESPMSFYTSYIKSLKNALEKNCPVFNSEFEFAKDNSNRTVGNHQQVSEAMHFWCEVSSALIKNSDDYTADIVLRNTIFDRITATSQDKNVEKDFIKYDSQFPNDKNIFKPFEEKSSDMLLKLTSNLEFEKHCLNSKGNIPSSTLLQKMIKTHETRGNDDNPIFQYLTLKSNYYQKAIAQLEEEIPKKIPEKDTSEYLSYAAKINELHTFYKDALAIETNRNAVFQNLIKNSHFSNLVQKGSDQNVILSRQKDLLKGIGINLTRLAMHCRVTKDPTNVKISMDMINGEKEKYLEQSAIVLPKCEASDNETLLLGRFLSLITKSQKWEAAVRSNNNFIDKTLSAQYNDITREINKLLTDHHNAIKASNKTNTSTTRDPTIIEQALAKLSEKNENERYLKLKNEVSQLTEQYEKFMKDIKNDNEIQKATAGIHQIQGRVAELIAQENGKTENKSMPIAIDKKSENKSTPTPVDDKIEKKPILTSVENKKQFMDNLSSLQTNMSAKQTQAQELTSHANGIESSAKQDSTENKPVPPEQTAQIQRTQLR